MSNPESDRPALPATAQVLDTYQQMVDRGDATAITALIRDQLDAGVDPMTLLLTVVAPTQRNVGLRWQSGEITVPQERAATALAIRATEAIAAHLSACPRTRGRVLIACVEREWHVLPAMIVDCAARAAGWDTTMMGASTNLVRFNEHLDRLGPDAVALSASVLGSLPTCRRFIEAATAAGVPVLVGGPAFGPDSQRALALGATAWAKDAADAVEALSELPAVVDLAPPLDVAALAEQAALADTHRRLVATLRQRWEAAATITASPAEDLLSVIDVLDDVLHQILHALQATLLTGDTRLLADTTEWVRAVLTARKSQPSLHAELATILPAALGDYPLTSVLLNDHLVLRPQTRSSVEQRSGN